MLSQPNENPHYKAGRTSKRRIAALGIAIMAAISILVTEAVVRERKDAFDRGSIEAANLSAGFEEQVRGTLDGGAMEILKGPIESEGASFNLSAWENRVLKLTRPVVEISIVDADGKVRATTTDYAGPPVYVTEQDYFQAHRDNPNLGFFIGAPVVGKMTKRLNISAARRLETKDGRFAGVLLFALDPEILTALHRQVNLGKNSTINLFRDDGVTLARYTSRNGLDASKLGMKAAPELMAWSRAELAEFSGHGPVDGITRLHSLRKVTGYPLFVVV